MSELPANWTPPPAPETPKGQRKTAWKPLLITLAASGVLGFITCAGGLGLLGKSSGVGQFLIVVALLLGAVFIGTLAGTVVYFFIWLLVNTGVKRNE